MARARTTTFAAVGVTLLAACGGDDEAATAAGAASAPEVAVVAEDVDFGADAYEAEARDITIEYVNEGVIEHSLVIEGVDDFRLYVETRGDTDRGSVELDPGSYRLICDIPGHARAGMVADLEVS
jgi:plastocyanin